MGNDGDRKPEDSRLLDLVGKQQAQIEKQQAKIMDLSDQLLHAQSRVQELYGQRKASQSLWMNIILWILQAILAAFFLMMGVSRLSFPDVSDLPAGLLYFAGTAEILAAAGLILSGFFRIQIRLTPLAAAGLVGFCLALAALCVLVGYGRWRISLLKDRSNATSL